MLLAAPHRPFLLAAATVCVQAQPFRSVDSVRWSVHQVPPGHALRYAGSSTWSVWFGLALLYFSYTYPDAPVIMESTITCQICGTAQTEMMPVYACQYFYECTGRSTLLRRKHGDCCVFRSYGSVPCPPIQASNGGPLCCQGEEGRGTAE